MTTYPLAWDLFAPGRPIVLARAPARLDVMGGIADYSGATVLELPLAQGVYAAAQTADDGLLAVQTAGPAVPSLAHPVVRLPIDAVYAGTPAEAPERLQAALAEADAHWAAYVLGPLAVLRAAELAPRIAGLRLAIWSDVPAGAGISSSAALEVAALRALQALFGLDIAPLRLANLAQQSEHRVALAPCGLMDQATATLGRQDHLLMLRCQQSDDQPARVLGHRPLPPGMHVLGIDSAVAHRVGGGQYGRVRTAAFMGRAMITAHDPADPPGGYLCNLSAERFIEVYAPLLPAELSGAAFLLQYGETGDDATRVEPETVYRVRDCTAHPIFEQANVAAFLAALDDYGNGRSDPATRRRALEAAGAAMYRSHESYGARCGLGTPETDLIVDLVRAEGPAHGLYGAKITGGGAGGTVAVLGAGPAVRAAVEAVAASYVRQSGNRAQVIAGSGEGAMAIPPQWVTVDTHGEVRTQ